jgi:SHS2 domain-containing protein
MAAGYREIEHTADWELEVWAPDIPGLLVQAAFGMFALSGMRLQSEPRLKRSFQCRFDDSESALVTFLAELLWFAEHDRLCFDTIDLQIETGWIFARLEGAPIAEQLKEIKAVTYHNLAVRTTGSGFSANIVFDV